MIGGNGMLESYYENKLRRAVQAMGCGALCLKLECPGYTGVPDRIILLPGGKVVFAETKQPGKKERRRQLYVHKVLRSLGFTVFSTVDSVEKIDAIIAHCRGVVGDDKTL
jgi:hypothetical protein